MADYDFRSLSPHDFELLCRDLLQKHLGVHSESFTTGRDSGIDFRYRGAGGMTESDEVFLAARACMLSGAETADDFRAVAKFCETYPGSVSGGERDTLKVQFETFAGDYASGWDNDSDPNWLRDIASDLERLGETFGVDTQGYTQGLLERADEVESERAEPEPDDDHDAGAPTLSWMMSRECSMACTAI